MKIPTNFYIFFWLKNSLLSLATGFLILLLIPPLFALTPWFGFILFVIYQVVIFKYFFGDLRGDFEYAYRMAIIEKMIRSAIRKKYGVFVFLRYLSDQLSQIRTFKEDYIVNLSTIKPECAEDIEFAICIKLAELSIRNGDSENEKKYLERAIEKKPTNLLSHFKLAVYLEGVGLGTDAIDHYKLALQDPYGITNQLRKFISQQISLVENYGPRKKPPMPGLRFLTW